MASQTKNKRKTYPKTNTWTGMRGRRVFNRTMKYKDFSKQVTGTEETIKYNSSERKGSGTRNEETKASAGSGLK